MTLLAAPSRPPRLPLLALAVSLLVGCRPTTPTSPAAVDDGATAAPTEPPADDGDALLAEYLEGMASRSPVSATQMGDHRFDHLWPDLSREGLAESRRWEASLQPRVERALRGCATADLCLDLELVRDALLASQLAEETQRPWSSDPLAYVGTLSGGLDDLVTRDFAPIDERATSLASRLEGLPAVVEHAKRNLQPAEALLAPHTGVAIGQLAGVRALVLHEIPTRMQSASPPLRERLAAATPAAVAAIDDLVTTLEARRPAAKGEWRLGASAFARKLPLTLQTRHSAEEVHALALAAHEQVSLEMATLARELHPRLFGARAAARIDAAADSPGAADRQIIAAVLDELADDHVAAPELRDAAEENLQRLAAFVRDHELVSIDEAEVLEVIWTPEHARGVAIAGLAAPGPLEPVAVGLPSFYLVQPVPEEWSEARRESFLREYNRFMLEILSIHEAIPGHFVQLYHGKRDASRVRRILANGPFVEGWAVYTEKLMVEQGYAGAAPRTRGKRPRGVSARLWALEQDPRLRAKAIALHRLKFYLRTVTNAILDYEIHAGEMSEDEAVAFMVERSFQGEGEARAKWVRAQLSSTQLSTYFVGANAWFELRKQAEARAAARGEPFELRRFHDEALAHGAPPVHRLPELMGW